MNYFNAVLKLMPSEWEEATYTTNRFVLVDVKEDSEEFNSLFDDLADFSIVQNDVVFVQRIQHPYAYGRYMLNKEQNQKAGRRTATQREVVHFKGNLSAVKIFIDYNCDERRNSNFIGDKFVVVKQVLNDFPVRDTNWYPEYLIKLK